MIVNCLSVGLGGFLGSVLRYLAGLIPVKTNGFPLTTLIINILGAFILSIVASLAAKGAPVSPRTVLFLKVGLCGGFTTFSTFAYESAKLIENGSTLSALCYMLASMVLGVLAILAGQLLTR